MHPSSRTARTLGLAACFSSAAWFLAAAPARGQYRQYGGEKQDFKSDSRDLAPTWPKEGPKQVWSRSLGEGYSGILVEEGRLYTQYRGEDRERIVCLDAATGKTVWEQGYEAPVDEGHVKEFGSGPRSTPLIVGDKIYTIGCFGALRCQDKRDGSLLWKHGLWDEFGGSKLNHGYSSSPVPYKDTVIVMVGGEGHSLMAFDQKSGEVRWKKQDFGNSYSTPKLARLDGEDHLLCFMAGEIAGVNPATGELLWSFAHSNQWKQNICQPILTEDNIVFFSSPEAGARALKLKKEGGRVTFEEVWSDRKLQFYHVTAVRDGDWIYGSSGTRSPCFFTAVNIKTGQVAWKDRTFAKATCVQADGRLVILDENGALGLATATPEFFQIHALTEVLGGRAWTVPTLVDNRLYLRDKEKILALDLS